TPQMYRNCFTSSTYRDLTHAIRQMLTIVPPEMNKTHPRQQGVTRMKLSFEVFCSYLLCFDVLDRFYAAIKPLVKELFNGRGCSSVMILLIKDKYVCPKNRLDAGMVNFDVYIMDHIQRRVILGRRSFLIGGTVGTGNLSVFGNLRVAYEPTLEKVVLAPPFLGREVSKRLPQTLEKVSPETLSSQTSAEDQTFGRSTDDEEFIVVRFRLDKLPGLGIGGVIK